MFHETIQFNNLGKEYNTKMETQDMFTQIVTNHVYLDVLGRET